MKRLSFTLVLMGISFIFISSCQKKSESIISNDADSYTFDDRIDYSIVNNTLRFTTTQDYERFLASKEKSIFLQEISLKGFVSLYKQSQENNSNGGISMQESKAGFPDSVLEDSESFASLLNRDAILTIENKSYKLDWPSQKVFAMDAGLINNPSDYNDLNSGNTQNSHVGEFSMDDDVLIAIGEGYTTSVGINDPNGIICWKRKGADGKSVNYAMYFFDETWSESINSLCANNPNYASCNTRLKAKVEYLRLGVYFHLYSQNKYQRQTGPTINGSPTWETQRSDVGENRWNINYTAKWRGKCRNQNEVNETGVLRPPYGNDNQAARTFWETGNGLEYFIVEESSDIFTSAIWTGWANEKTLCITADKRLIVSPARLVNNTRVYPFKKLVIRYGI